MQTVTTAAALRQALAPVRAAGRRVGLVPTMGYLHEGHLSLVDRARQESDVIVLSCFVNPLQFGPGEDLERYPRDLARDTALAAARGVDLFYAPSVSDMYPLGPSRVRVTAPELADRLCGAYRPGHFDGVLTVVAKLFQRVQPAVAVFGQKDLQQVALIRRMAAELDFSVVVRSAPIVREADGLALSSRNVYLGPAERAAARSLHRALAAARNAYRRGTTARDALVEAVGAVLEKEPLVRPQYIELVHPETLEPLGQAEPGSALAVAAFVGGTRLIDNLLLDAGE